MSSAVPGQKALRYRGEMSEFRGDVPDGGSWWRQTAESRRSRFAGAGFHRINRQHGSRHSIFSLDLVVWPTDTLRKAVSAWRMPSVGNRPGSADCQTD